MDTPQSVDISKLKGILGRAKAHINNDVVTEQVKNTGKNQPLPPRSQMEEEIEYLTELPQQTQPQQPQMQEGQMSRDVSQIDVSRGGYRNIETSKMPDEIKKLMIENQIEQSNPLMGQQFNAEDMGDLLEQPTQQPQTQQKSTKKYSGLNEQQIRSVVRDEMLKFFSGEFTKKLKENTIKNTIQTLINEGKIKTKPKRKS